jgi:hypothetical protein
MVRNCAPENPSARITRCEMNSGLATSSCPGTARGATIPWLPDGQNTQLVGQCAQPKIFHFTEIRKVRMCRANPAQGRGAYRDRHDAGRTAVDADCIGAKSFAGRATVSESVAHTTGVIPAYGKIVWS